MTLIRLTDVPIRVRCLILYYSSIEQRFKFKVETLRFNRGLFRLFDFRI